MVFIDRTYDLCNLNGWRYVLALHWFYTKEKVGFSLWEHFSLHSVYISFYLQPVSFHSIAFQRYKQDDRFCKAFSAFFFLLTLSTVRAES